MTQTTHLTITNVHPRGFGFAVVTQTGEQAFIPPHTAKAVESLAAGDSIDAVLVPNPRPDHAATTPTPWLAVKLIDSAGPELDQAPEPELETKEAAGVPLDERAYSALRTVAYATNSDMAQMLNEDFRSTSNAMQRLYNAGRISRACVYHRVGQQRPSFLLYAITASDFVEGDV